MRKPSFWPLVIWLLVLLFGGSNYHLQAISSQNLLYDVQVEKAPVTPVGPTGGVLRQQTIDVQLELLPRLVGPQDSLLAELELPLFDEQVLTFVGRQRLVNQKNPRVVSWYGVIETDPENFAVITTDGRALVGQIFADGRFYRIRSHLLQEMDTAREGSGPDSDARIPPVQTRPKSSPPPNALRPHNVVDLMILYTPEVASRATNLDLEITNAVDTMNVVLARSCVDFRVRLAHQAEVSSYDETGNSNSDLSRLSGQSDGEIDEIHSWRDNYKADLVQLWVATNNDYCGLAWNPTHRGNMGQEHAFSIHTYSCSVLSMIHELGHNFALGHDRFTQDEHPFESGGISSNHHAGRGYVLVDQSVRTIMAYNDQCAAYGRECTRIPYFSNPRILYGGEELGAAGTADSAAILNANYDLVADYRSSDEPYQVIPAGACEAAGSQSHSLHSCFVASATFGSPLHRYVGLLRTFRDQTLLPLPGGIGQFLVARYYAWSPQIANLISASPVMRQISQILLSPLILMIYYGVGPSIFVGAIFLSLLFWRCRARTLVGLLLLMVTTDLMAFTAFPRPAEFGNVRADVRAPQAFVPVTGAMVAAAYNEDQQTFNTYEEFAWTQKRLMAALTFAPSGAAWERWSFHAASDLAHAQRLEFNWKGRDLLVKSDFQMYRLLAQHQFLGPWQQWHLGIGGERRTYRSPDQRAQWDSLLIGLRRTSSQLPSYALMIEQNFDRDPNAPRLLSKKYEAAIGLNLEPSWATQFRLVYAPRAVRAAQGNQAVARQQEEATIEWELMWRPWSVLNSALLGTVHNYTQTHLYARSKRQTHTHTLYWAWMLDPRWVVAGEGTVTWMRERDQRRWQQRTLMVTLTHHLAAPQAF